VRPLKFRHNAAIAIAGVIALLGSIPLATSAWYLLPIMVVPVLSAIWAWRAGTNVYAGGVEPRALLTGHFIPWSRISAFVPDAKGRVYAVLAEGGSMRLPAVTAADMPGLVAASGTEQLARTPDAR
jgi:hypothetical protein